VTRSLPFATDAGECAAAEDRCALAEGSRIRASRRRLPVSRATTERAEEAFHSARDRSSAEGASAFRAAGELRGVGGRFGSAPALLAVGVCSLDLPADEPSTGVETAIGDDFVSSGAGSGAAAATGAGSGADATGGAGGGGPDVGLGVGPGEDAGVGFGAGVGVGAGAGGGAGSGTGGATGARTGRSVAGSTYFSASPARTPRWTYGASCSGSPDGPGTAITSPSLTRAPRLTASGPRCVKDAFRPSGVVIVTVSPWVGTWPAKVTSPDVGARTTVDAPAATSRPRCWPAAYSSSPSANPRSTGPSTGQVHARAPGASASTRSMSSTVPMRSLVARRANMERG
jgi:hypothetical protein